MLSVLREHESDLEAVPCSRSTESMPPGQPSSGVERLQSSKGFQRAVRATCISWIARPVWVRAARWPFEDEDRDDELLAICM